MPCYALKDPRDRRTRYVGKSIRPERRLSGHLARGAPRVKAWVSELNMLGLRPYLVVFADGTGSEKEWIERLRPDLNTMPGDSAGMDGRRIGVLISMRPEELLRYRAAAAKAGLSFSAFIRQAVDEKIRRDGLG